VLLIAAGLLEVVWAVALKQSDGLTPRSPATYVFLVAALASFALLAAALRSLPVGTGYAVWTGIGAVGAALVGVLALGEPAAPARQGGNA
jgi:quaternary ammonium compound-resistance protein SugE